VGVNQQPFIAQIAPSYAITLPAMGIGLSFVEYLRVSLQYGIAELLPF
jgi:hypothetical protein